MATLLKRKVKATNVAMIVWSPRKGEKAMNTPIEKASAVRSGGSSSASKRRKVERNIKTFRVLSFGVSDKQTRNSKPGTRNNYLKLFNASASLSKESNTVRSLVMTSRF